MTKTEHIRAIDLERYFAGELAATNKDEIRLHLEGCAECGAALKRLETERERFLTKYPFNKFAGAEKVVKKKINVFDSIIKSSKKIFADVSFIPRPYGAVFALIAALIFIPFALITYWDKSSMDDSVIESTGGGRGGGVRYKGVEKLSFMLMRGGEGVRQGSPAETYRGGDRLQVVYSYPKRHQVALFSVDNAGAVSFYNGNDNDSICSIQADSGSDLTVPSSIVLDDSRGEELLVMLISETPVLSKNVGDVVRRLSGGNYDDLSKIEDGLRRGAFSKDISVSSVRIKKE